MLLLRLGMKWFLNFWKLVTVIVIHREKMAALAFMQLDTTVSTHMASIYINTYLYTHGNTILHQSTVIKPTSPHISLGLFYAICWDIFWFMLVGLHLLSFYIQTKSNNTEHWNYETSSTLAFYFYFIFPV